MISQLDTIFSPQAWAELPTARFYGNLRSLAQDPANRVHLHHSRRFGEKQSWQGVLTIENRPVAYFLKARHRDPLAEAELHRAIWNQGVANLLIVCDPQETRVYSAHARPRAHAITPDHDLRLVESLRTADFALQLRDFALRLETSTYYRDNASSFPEKERVDSYLLNNLRVTRDLLTDNGQGSPGALSLSAAHTLLGRILFVCYLRDRGIIDGKHFASAGAKPGIDSLLSLFREQSPGEARNVFFKLLRQLKDDFNGSLFDRPTREEERNITLRHIQLLGQFLAGEEIGRKQMVLGFAAYDFGLIPIELVSGIYEEFLAAESRVKKDADGAFYTPKRLAEITARLATEDWPALADKRVLDPSCGSGIFLVLAFNRMAEEWRHEHANSPHRRRADALRHILTHQLCGVDKNLTACRIAAFSLYVAFFDQFDPRDLEEVRASLAGEGRRVLPALLPDPDEPSTETLNGGLIPENFFTLTPERLGRFDLILGNPPWVGRGNDLDPAMLAWVDVARAQFKGEPLRPRQKKAPRDAFLPQNQSAHAFMWKVRDHLAIEGGRACLVLPSKLWLNKDTAVFQSFWSRTVTLERVVQLADARHVLFEDAKCPCVLARFTAQPPPPDHVIAYTVPKVDVREPGDLGCIVLPEDEKRVTQLEWQQAADQAEGQHTLLWKSRFWGTPADERLIARLARFPRLEELAGLEREKKRWLKGQGFQPNSRGNAENPEPVFWQPTDLYLDANTEGIDLLLFPKDASKIGSPYESLYFARNPLIYQPPMVLTNQGFDWSAYCDFPVLFQDSIQSIRGEPEDAPLLKFLAGYLGSDVARYFAFHSSANWGVERDKVNFDEMLRCPFPLPEQLTDPEKAWGLVRAVGDEIEGVRRAASGILSARADAVKQARRAINRHVADYFSLTTHERALVADTIKVVIPSSTPASRERAHHIPTLLPSQPEHRLGYAKQVAALFARWGGPASAPMQITIHTAPRVDLAVLIVEAANEKTEPRELPSSAEASRLLEHIGQRMRAENSSDGLPYLRGCAVMEAERILVLKPLSRRHWTYGAAVADAQSLTEALTAQKG